MRFELYCDGCGKWRGFSGREENPKCPECKTAAWLSDNEPHRTRGLAEYYGPDESDFHSDADPGL